MMILSYKKQSGIRIGLNKVRSTGLLYGYYLLSDSYKNDSTPLLWRCRDCGTDVEYTFKRIRDMPPKRCPECWKRFRMGKWASRLIDGMKIWRKHCCELRKEREPYEFAESKNGECLGKATVENLPTNQRQHIGADSFTWICEHVHVWTAKFDIAKRQWCYHCRIFKKIFQTVKSNNWECLSRTYDGAKVPLELRCDKGHEFPMTKWGIESGYLCPVCNPIDKKTREGYAHEELCKEALIVLGYEGYGITADKYELSTGDNGESCMPDFVLFGLERTWFDAKRSNFTMNVRETIKKYSPHCDDLCIIYLRGKPRSPKGKVRFLPITHFYKRLKKIQQFDLIQDIENLRMFGTIPDRFSNEIHRMIAEGKQMSIDTWA